MTGTSKRTVIILNKKYGYIAVVVNPIPAGHQAIGGLDRVLKDALDTRKYLIRHSTNRYLQMIALAWILGLDLSYVFLWPNLLRGSCCPLMVNFASL